MSTIRMPDVSDGEPRYSAPALEKGLDILERLSDADRALSLGEVADALGRTRSEIFRMMTVLERRGYLERDAPDRFRLADKLFRLGLNRPSYRSLTAAALPAMQRFAEETGYSCHMAVASETQMVVVARVESFSHIGFSVRIGYRQPLTLTGSGHCLLAFMSPRRLGRTLEALGREDPALDAEALLADLARHRAAGRVVRPSGVAEGVTDLSAPVVDEQELGAVAALTSPYIRMRRGAVEPEALAERVAAAAREVSAAIKLV